MATKTKSLSKNPERILLGYGAFYINGIPIGLTRGGGQFVVERESRQIEADGDRGYIKGRNVFDKVTPKLTLKALEVIHENLPKLYSSMKIENKEGGWKITGTGTGVIADTDYHEVSWVGVTKDGREVVIAIENAVNLDNLDWTLADKDEVVASLTYIGCFEENSPADYEPWSITYAA